MESLKEYFDQQNKKRAEKFNIFEVMHHIADERRLHSRFISYLLSTKKYLDAFLKVSNITDFNIQGCKIIPDPKEKIEFENIDILLYNDKEAIIVENKIFANDNNMVDKPVGYNGQLERYYNTISTRKNIKGEDFKGNVNAVIYLTLAKREPSSKSQGNIPPEKIKLIDYHRNIVEWLDTCIQKTPSNECNLLNSIIQYRELVIKLTSDIDKAHENQRKIAGSIVEAWELERKDKYFTKDCQEVFKHVRWHTVAKFFNELEERIGVGGCVVKPSPEQITLVTHNQKDNSNTKLIFKFKHKGVDMQIVNDKKGFTLGNLSEKKWDFFNEQTIKIKDIKFSDFSNETTFKVIDPKFRMELIDALIKGTDEQYLRLKNVL